MSTQLFLKKAMQLQRNGESKVLIKILKSAVKDKTIALNQSGYVIFHHIDDWPALNLRTGRSFRL